MQTALLTDKAKKSSNVNAEFNEATYKEISSHMVRERLAEFGRK